MCSETSTKTIIVAFYRPTEWWGWGIAYFQLLLGVKYWQVTHVELMTDEGLYAYRINHTIIASYDPYLCNPDYKICLPDHVGGGGRSRWDRAWLLRRKWGDFSPYSLLSGNHCVRFVNKVLDLNFKTNLPGQFLEYLELRDVYRVLHRPDVK